jgi:hypothetical protein
MEDYDPWHVTPTQQQLRDIAPRRYPPPIEVRNALLPIDDELWKEEVANDEEYQARYFVTNLHGGTLLINGMQVKRGQVAGPLPEFAVIEYPGGQVAFWWGVGGRNYRSGPEDRNWEAHWHTFRQNPEWKHVAIPAGQVWDEKIRERKKRERGGEDWERDEEWKTYKRARTASWHQDGGGDQPGMF